jgi:hypothetical protein
MSRRAATVAVLGLALAAGCGGDDDEPKSADRPPAATEERGGPPGRGAGGGGDQEGVEQPTGDRARDYQRAKAAMAEDDFDSALALMRSVGDYRDAPQLVERYRDRAAATTLRIARKRLREVRARNDSPQPAVSLARNSLRYRETPEARAFLRRAQAELARFKRERGDGA